MEHHDPSQFVPAPESGVAERRRDLAEHRRDLPSPPSESAAALGLWDAISIIVGIVVGTGIFETPPFFLKQVSGPEMALTIWALGGVLSFIGALCYAELATAYPRSGGDYVYLTRAYGELDGFLFGWAQLAVILTASIGMMAYVFSDYAVRLIGAAHVPGYVYAVGAVVGLTLLNLLGIRAGKGTQNLLTAVKVLGLAAVVVVGFMVSPEQPASPAAETAPGGEVKLAFAMVLVLLTYGGWNDAAYVAAEVRNGARNIPRALLLGIGIITLLYVLINAAYLHALGFEGARASNAVAADVLDRYWPAWGEKAMCLLVMISALGTVNGLLLSGSRVCSSLGADHALFAGLGRWDRQRGAPSPALIALGGVSTAMILAIGTPWGRGAIDAAFDHAGLGAIEWSGAGGFETLLKCTAPVFWVFFLMTGVSLFVLRAKDRGRPRPFMVPLFPVVPLLFCAICTYMVYSGVTYAGKLGLIGGGLMLLGVPLYGLSWWLKTPAGERKAG
jgi:amino acid transporter